MRRLLCAALVSITASPLAATPSPKTYEVWTVACDNTGSCVVLGAADSDDLLYLRIARAAGATASPTVKIVLQTQDPVKGTEAAFAMKAVTDGVATALGPYPTAAATDDSNTLSTMLDEAKSLTVIDAIRNAATLDTMVLGHKGSFALKGLPAALRDLDARQGRAGTPTALVAKGMTPIGQVPPPVAPPLVEAAAPGSVTTIEKPLLSKPLQELATAACDPDTVAAHEGLEAWRLAPDSVLTAVPCESGAYNFTAALYVTDGKGASHPVMLPQPPGITDGETSAANMLINENFDPKTMMLTSYAKGRGIGDCGTLTDWLWTGTAFVLLDASGLDACPGALAEDWPSLYVAKRK